MPLSFDDFILTIEEAVFAELENDDDHRIFISSYLHGHISLIAAGISSTTDAKNEFISGVETSLRNAFANNELEKHDQQSVWTYWRQLIDFE